MAPDSTQLSLFGAAILTTGGGVFGAVLAYRRSGQSNAVDGFDKLVTQTHKVYEAQIADYRERLRRQVEETAEEAEARAAAEARVRILENTLREHDIADPEDVGRDAT